MYAWILHFFANWIWSLNLPSTSTLWCGFGARRWSIFHVFPSPESPGVNITHLYKTKKVYFLGLAMRLRNMRRSDICAEYSDICRICGSCEWCASADVSAWPTRVCSHWVLPNTQQPLLSNVTFHFLIQCYVSHSGSLVLYQFHSGPCNTYHADAMPCYAIPSNVT